MVAATTRKKGSRFVRRRAGVFPMRPESIYLDKRGACRGQTILEMALILGSVLFFSFLTIQFTMIWQSRLVARYAAFMTARSLQVWGGGGQIKWTPAEVYGGGSNTKAFPFRKVFEDIYTCGVPWARVPPDDLKNRAETDDYIVHCGATGERKYEQTNLYEARAKRYDDKDPQGVGMHRVGNSFFEMINFCSGPQCASTSDLPLRFGVLEVTYKVPLLFGIVPGVAKKTEELTKGVVAGGLIDGVAAPLLLNPGLLVTDSNGKPL